MFLVTFLLDVDVEIEEICRLPQKPVIKDGKKVIRPIIVKLANATTKHDIFGNLKQLKAYNRAKKLEGKPLLSVTEKFLEQKIYKKKVFGTKKLLMPHLIQAKKKISRKHHGGLKMANALYVNQKKIPLPGDYSSKT